MFDSLTGNALDQFGIVPRQVRGLIGIPLAPVLHAGFAHLLSNTLPLLILGGFVAFRGKSILIGLIVFVNIVGGLGTWIIGSTGVHLGASILVFGFFGYLVARGWYDRSFISIAVAIVVLILYGGLIFGVLPVRAFVSWEGHLLGMLAGVVYARIYRKKRELT